MSTGHTLNPTGRFSSRVADYVRYRPGYPPAITALLQRECGLSPASVVADLGCGTGLFARIFLAAGARVIGVEPNREMREACEVELAREPNFSALDATAEATRLPPATLDFVAAGQAFHWFDPARVWSEMCRILKTRGWIVLAWNERRTEGSAFLRDYEQLLSAYATDYSLVRHRETDPEALGVAFSIDTFDNRQDFDFEGTRGRLLSSSYAPQAGEPGHEPMLAELRRIFDANSVDGRVEFAYTTRVYRWQLD